MPAGAHFWVGDGPQPSPKGRIVPYPQNPDDIDLFEIMNSIEEERRRKNMKRFNQINNLDSGGGLGERTSGGGGGEAKNGTQPKYGRREPPSLQRMKGRYSNDVCKMFGIIPSLVTATLTQPINYVI